MGRGRKRKQHGTSDSAGGTVKQSKLTSFFTMTHQQQAKQQQENDEKNQPRRDNDENQPQQDNIQQQQWQRQKQKQNDATHQQHLQEAPIPHGVHVDNNDDYEVVCLDEETRGEVEVLCSTTNSNDSVLSVSSRSMISHGSEKDKEKSVVCLEEKSASCCSVDMMMTDKNQVEDESKGFKQAKRTGNEYNNKNKNNCTSLVTKCIGLGSAAFFHNGKLQRNNKKKVGPPKKTNDTEHVNRNEEERKPEAVNRDVQKKDFGRFIPLCLMEKRDEFLGPKPTICSLLCWIKATFKFPAFQEVVDAATTETIKVWLKPEPMNEADPFALRVDSMDGFGLGYIDRPTARFFTPLLTSSRPFFTNIHAFLVIPPDKSEPNTAYPVCIVFRFKEATFRDIFYAVSLKKTMTSKDVARGRKKAKKSVTNIQVASASFSGFSKASELMTRAMTFQQEEPEPSETPEQVIDSAIEGLKDALKTRKKAKYLAWLNSSKVSSGKRKQFQTTLDGASHVKALVSASSSFTTSSSSSSIGMTSDRWETLTPSILEQIFESAVLSFRDVLCVVRAVCKSWKAVVDRPGFMKYRKVFWRALLKSPNDTEIKLANYFDNSILTVSELANQLNIRFPWFTELLVKDLLNQEKIQTSPVINMVNGNGNPGLMFIVPLLYGGSEVREILVKRFIPRDFRTCMAIHVAGQRARKDLGSRSMRLELMYFIVSVLYSSSFSGAGNENDNNDACLMSWNQVRLELEHMISLFAQASSLIVQPTFMYDNAFNKFMLTPEQLAIIQTDVKPGQLMIVNAKAGSGKTTTLKHFARAKMDKKILYLSFNVSVRENAESIFPVNVTCKTLHQLAYAYVGYKYRHKLKSELSGARMVRALAERNIVVWSGRDIYMFQGARYDLKESDISNLIKLTLGAFFASMDAAVRSEHFTYPQEFLDRRDFQIKQGNMVDLVDHVVSLSEAAWECIKDEHNDIAKICHSGYLKLFQLRKVDVTQGGKKFDIIMLDEGQDTNNCSRDIVMSQKKCARIIVGDCHQAIYGFLGTRDALKVGKMYPDENIVHLSLSSCFRFGKEIAHVVNNLLQRKKGERKLLLGASPAPGRVVSFNRSNEHAALLKNMFQLESTSQDITRKNRQIALVCRTNAEVLAQVAVLTGHEPDAKFRVLGELDKLKLSKLRDLQSLAQGDFDQVNDRTIARYGSLEAVLEAVHSRQADDLRFLQRIVPYVPSNSFDALPDRIANGVSKSSRFIVTNTHQSKGLEFDTVLIGDDFVPVGIGNLDVEEINVLYVALTRAKTELIMAHSVLGRINFCLYTPLVVRKDPPHPEQTEPPKCEMCKTFEEVPIPLETLLPEAPRNELEVVFRSSVCEDQPDIILCAKCAGV